MWTAKNRDWLQSPKPCLQRISYAISSFCPTSADGLQFIKNGFLYDRKLRVSKIAWLLGFHEVSAFTHAFKRWTGKTPSQMRTAGAF
jgi:AraC-like DNA-binding protein